MSASPIKRLAGVRWDVSARNYRLPNGRFLSKDGLLEILERELVAAKVRFRALGQELIDGRINLASFQIQLEGLTRRAILVGASLEKGGFQQMTGGDLGFVGQRVRAAFDAIRNLARELETGRQKLNGTLLSRLDQYGQEHRAAQRAMQVRIARQDGHTERRRVLAPADHCRDSADRPGCIEQSRLGWRAIDDPVLVEIGACTCRRNDRCGWEFRGGRAAA